MPGVYHLCSTLNVSAHGLKNEFSIFTCMCSRLVSAHGLKTEVFYF